MNDLSLDELLASGGPSEPRLREIMIEVALNLLESRIVVRTELLAPRERERCVCNTVPKRRTR